MPSLLENWLIWDDNPNSRATVSKLATSDPKEFEAIMKPRISFGTAGLRGKMAPGFANMNSVTVRQASQGLANYVATTTSNRRMIVGHDHRHHSEEFSRIVEEAFTVKGFEVHSLGLVPTPFVPLAVSEHSASCGVMVTASHNPGIDNGYKVYWSNACQIIPPHDEGIAKEIDMLTAPWPKPDLSHVIRGSDEIKAAYLAYLKDITFDSPQEHAEALKIVYTPMHGTGFDVLPEAIKNLPFDVELVVVKEQVVKDPDFKTVRFPNPEEKGALDLAFHYGDLAGADVVIANDPDADRFASAIHDPKTGKWRRLTGDEVGTLLGDFLLKNISSQPNKIGDAIKGVTIVNSTVSSRRLQRLASFYGAQYEETLTGFKWIGNKVLNLRSEHRSVPFAYEEALGYMCLPQIADKDGISAAIVFVQMLYRLTGAAGVISSLEELGSRLGHFSTYNSYYRTSDLSAVADAFKVARENLKSGSGIGKMRVESWRDLTLGYDSSTVDHAPVLPVSTSTEMLTVDAVLDEGERLRFTARGSGTEPKLKIYIEAVAPSLPQATRASLVAWETLHTHWFNDPRLTSEDSTKQ